MDVQTRAELNLLRRSIEAKGIDAAVSFKDDKIVLWINTALGTLRLRLKSFIIALRICEDYRNNMALYAEFKAGRRKTPTMVYDKYDQHIERFR